jgi:hypothetical protein
MMLNKALLSFALALPLMAGSVTGKWDVSAQDPDGNVIKSVMTLKDDGGKLAGELSASGGTLPLIAPKVENNDFTCKLEWEGGIMLVFKMKVDGDSMKGEWQTEDGSASGPISAMKAKAAEAGVAGKWSIKAKTPDGDEVDASMDLKEEAGKVTGSVLMHDGESRPIENGKWESNGLTFDIPVPDGKFTVKLTMTEGTLKGAYTAPDGSTGPLTAKR